MRWEIVQKSLAGFSLNQNTTYYMKNANCRISPEKS